MDSRLGRQVALASAYNLLHRHGWRKLGPDQRHPKSDVEIQEAWKKIPRDHKQNQRSMAWGRTDLIDVCGQGPFRSYF